MKGMVKLFDTSRYTNSLLTDAVLINTKVETTKVEYVGLSDLMNQATELLKEHYKDDARFGSLTVKELTYGELLFEVRGKEESLLAIGIFIYTEK